MKKWTVSSILYLLVFFMISGCAKKEVDYNTFNIKSIEEDIDEENNKKIINKENVDLNSYYNSLDEINITYNFPEYCMTDEQAEQILYAANSLKECQNKKTVNKIDVFSALCENSLNEEKSPFEYLENNNSDLNFSNILYKAVENTFASDTRLQEDYCVIKDIIITMEDSGEEYVAASYYYEEKRVVLYYNTIVNSYNTLKKLDSEENQEFLFESLEDYFAYILQHELNHTRQHACDCRMKAGQANSSIKLHGFMSTLESTAEGQICNEEIIMQKKSGFDKYDFTYDAELEIQTYLMLYGFLKGDFTSEKFYEAVFNSDLKTILEIYDLKTKEEIKEFYNFMYSLETIKGYTKLASDIINKNKNISVADFKKLVGDSHKSYLLKNNIKDLMLNVYNEELSFEESLCLYRHLKNYAILGTGVALLNENDEVEYVYDEQFVRDIKALENIYISYISQIFNVSREDVIEYLKSEELDKEILALGIYEGLLSESKYYNIRNDILEKYPILLEMSFHLPCFHDGNFEIFAEKNNLGISLERIR